MLAEAPVLLPPLELRAKGVTDEEIGRLLDAEMAREARTGGRRG